ncbi:DUF1648 domain-containing protein [Dictyobacter arantiisoli]|uniref:DUF1648 domain-containing protein n=1 Tax=Dictyobacter arantiisoli TaxID=2014874 RepID=A0A5A5TJ81_9CHLR|nr:DUF1648 domain-containing protein [Dictyobacter arantiisoli]GCF11278.1 hypothetical protein KDI_48420 [Dictyobacter arantiisoli]
MTTMVILMDILSLAVLLFAWFWPNMMQPTLPFGVRIPPDRIQAPIIAHARREYRLSLLVIALLVVASGWFLYAELLAGPGSLLVTLILLFLAFFSAHTRIAQVKAREDWYAGLRQVVMTDTDLHQVNTKISWLWLLPSLLLLAAMIVIAIVRYPALPAVIPTHFGLNGQPDAWTTKAAGLLTTFIPTILINALILGLAYFPPVLRQQIDPTNPKADIQRQRLMRQDLTKILLGMITFVNVVFLMTMLMVTNVLSGDYSSLLFSAIMGGAILLILGLLAYVGYITARRNHTQADATSQGTPKDTVVTRDDDRFWPGGIFYNNPDDPAIFVSKRFGLGGTINFGHPIGKAITVVFIVFIVGIVILAKFTAH